MQKIFLMTFILACLLIPVRRARRQKAYPLGRVITDFIFYSIGFGFLLRFFFGRMG
jgi:maltodextrin utilization protein YvdJ